MAWLTVSPEIGAKRFTSGAHRPWYGEDPVTFLARQAREREPAFRSLDPRRSWRPTTASLARRVRGRRSY